MVGSIDQQGLRFHRAMLGVCAALFAYMLGMLTMTVRLGGDYSVLRRMVVGALVLGSAALLTYQVGKLRALVENAQRPGRSDARDDLSGQAADDAEW